MNLIVLILFLSALWFDHHIHCANSTIASSDLDPAEPDIFQPRGDILDLTTTRCDKVEPKQTRTILQVFTKPPGESYEPDYSSDVETTREILKSERSFDPTKPTYLIIHGYLRGCLKDLTWAKKLLTTLYDKESYNVLYADWKHKSAVWNYWDAFKDVTGVAKEIHFILKEYEQAFSDFQLTNIHILGFSLGAQVAGVLGQLASGEINQITALDPAGISMPNEPDRIITKDDAKYVLVYHTSSSLSTSKLVGDVDIFFEGGSNQPFCRRKLTSFFCSHFAAAYYSATYVGKCIMVGYACPSFENFLLGECGFCNSDSDNCTGVGHDWQYEEDVDFRPSHFDEVKSDREVWRDAGTRFFVKMGEEAPYCTFTYQLVLKFSNKIKTKFKYLRLRLDLKDKPELGVEVELFNRVKENVTLSVFRKVRMLNFSSKVRLVSGVNVFTALLVVQNNTQLFQEMPIRFNRARIIEENYGFFGSGDRIDIKGAELYVNFMSHHSFDERAAYSGPIALEFGEVIESARKGKSQKGRSKSRSGFKRAFGILKSTKIHKKKKDKKPK